MKIEKIQKKSSTDLEQTKITLEIGDNEANYISLLYKGMFIRLVQSVEFIVITDKRVEIGSGLELLLKELGGKNK